MRDHDHTHIKTAKCNMKRKIFHLYGRTDEELHVGLYGGIHKENVYKNMHTRIRDYDNKTSLTHSLVINA